MDRLKNKCAIITGGAGGIGVAGDDEGVVGKLLSEQRDLAEDGE